MKSNDIDSFQNGDVGLDVVRLQDPVENRFWVKAGLGAIEFTEEGFDQLVELLAAYEAETEVTSKGFFEQRVGILVGVLALGFFVGLVFGLVIGAI